MTGLVAPLLVAFGVALSATLVCERLARRFQVVARPRADRWHRGPVPLLGGVAIMLAVLIGAAVVEHGPTRFGPILLVAVAMGVVGLVDDLRPLPPQVKLVAQVLLAGGLLLLGFLLRLTPKPEVNALLTVVWVVGVTNALNLLDNMDGLAAGMAVVAGSFRIGFFLLDGDAVGAGVTAAFTGAVAGFLVRNLPPAKVFMGDAGSLFIGFFLSGICLVGQYPYTRGITAVLLLPVLLMLVPIFDTTFVTVTRFLTGRRVSQGGRDHTSHRLVALGITEGQALASLCTVSALAGLLAVVSYRYGLTHTVVLVALLLVALVMLGVYLSRVEVVGADGAPPDRPVVRVVADLPFKRQLASVALDLVLLVVAYYAAYLLRFEDIFERQRPVFLATIIPVALLQLGVLAAFGVYRGIWRYTGLAELSRLLQAITVGSAASVLYFVLTTRFAGLSRAVFVLDWLLLVMLLGGSRVSLRFLDELLRRPGEDSRPVLIYGAGDGGELALRELRNNLALRRTVVGFVDDDPAKAGGRIHGVPVLGSLDGLEELLGRHSVSEVVVASRKIPPERLRQLGAICVGRSIAVVRASVRVE